MRRAEIVTAVVLALFSLYVMWKSGQPAWEGIPWFSNIGYVRGEGPGTGFWPFWLATLQSGVGLVLLSVLFSFLTSCIAGAARHVGRCPGELVHSLGVAERDVRIRSEHPWAIDTRMVRHPESGERCLCHRPRFDDWHLDLTLLVDRDAISGADVRTLLETAGVRVGLGDFRPERNGPFGRFVITAWDIL